jgi:hypothetical protein
MNLYGWCGCTAVCGSARQCGSVRQCAAVCVSVLGSVWQCARQCVAVSAVRQCVAVQQCESMRQFLQNDSVRLCELQCVAVFPGNCPLAVGTRACAIQ